MGSERYGITKPWYQHGFGLVGVPMLGYADSLNVSVSASVLLYEARAHKELLPSDPRSSRPPGQTSRRRAP
ncbi:MAG: TrmH family RNA methyltransferase [Pseudonocardiaceae bacterium]